VPDSRTIVVPSPVWYEPEPETPAIPITATGLDFALLPARNAQESTVALLARWRLPARFERMYGGRVNAAIEIVAVDALTGGVWNGVAETGKTVPLASVMNADPPERPGGPIAFGSTFNIDLVKHLGLPHERRSYSVFLWIDTLMSPSRTFEAPGEAPKARPDAAPAAESALELTKSPGPPGAGTAPVLELAEPRRLDQLTGPKILGSVRRPEIDPDARVPLTVLALCHRSRRLWWRSKQLSDIHWDEGACHFEVSLRELSAGRETPEKAFVIAVVGGARSEILEVEIPPE
jgi:hypothetical protein